MISHWFSRVNSVIPRGFSRQYILNLLKEKPMSGKEIIDFAIYESEGKWKPSPGLIYPMLGRLLEEGLISETENIKLHTKVLELQKIFNRYKRYYKNNWMLCLGLEV